MPNLIDAPNFPAYRTMEERMSVAWKPEVADRFPPLPIPSLPLSRRTRGALAGLVGALLVPLTAGVTAGVIYAEKPSSAQTPDNPGITWQAPDELMARYQQGSQLRQPLQITGPDYPPTVEIQASVVGADTLKSAIVPQRDISSLRVDSNLSSSIEGSFATAKQQALSAYPGPNEGKQPVSPEEPQKKPAIPSYPGPDQADLTHNQPFVRIGESSPKDNVSLLKEAVAGDGLIILFNDALPKGSFTLDSINRRVSETPELIALDPFTARAKATYQLIIENSSKSQANTRALLTRLKDEGKIKGWVSFPAGNMITVVGASKTVEDLIKAASSNEVKLAIWDRPVQIDRGFGRLSSEAEPPTDFQWYQRDIGIPEVRHIGIKGWSSGRVCIVDSGLVYPSGFPQRDRAFNAVADAYATFSPEPVYDYNWMDVSRSPSSTPVDNDDHGSVGAWMIAGEQFVAVAPLSTFRSIRNGDNIVDNNTLTSLAAAYQMAVAPWRYGELPVQGDDSRGCRLVLQAWGLNPWWYPEAEPVLCPFERTFARAGILSVVASGNSGRDSAVPARCGDDEFNVFGVTGYGQDHVVASPFARDKFVDLGAPGRSITAAVPYLGRLGSSTGYRDISGTSTAAFITTGAAELLLSMNPYLTREEVIDILTTTGDGLAVSGVSPTEEPIHIPKLELWAAVQEAARRSNLNIFGPFPYKIYIP